ncbi:hypothetical protein ACFV1L_10340 [Kitasatospora sp. NPDC059646]|uniref:hypothetical protein n=1 Tax=Kitasatospora sp. NPDC059646 TaxID=3346893 RepID=UPI003687F2C3
MKKSLIVAVAALALTLTGCSAATEQWNDAPVQRKDDSPAVIYSMPDGFANVASKCDGNGFRMFVTREGTNKGGGKAVAVVADPTCKR